jgi:hypothetical protein
MREQAMDAIYVSPYLRLKLRELCDVADERARRAAGRVAIVETLLNGPNCGNGFGPGQEPWPAGTLRECQP